MDTLDKFRELSASLKANADELRRDGVYGCCAGTYRHAAAQIDAILRESEAQSTSQKAVAWARPVYARPVNAPGTGEWDELVDIEFHTRPEKPEGGGLVSAGRRPRRPATGMRWMTAYYNEFDPYAAQWLRNLIAERLIPAGEVDERSIVDVQPGDLAGFTQCHFFAGIGGWALAARLAGWPDDRELWTGSPPCQPFSVAGKGKAQADDRHLWPHLFRLASARRPAVLMGEQVAAAVGKNWLDGVFADLEGIGYACRAVVVPACAVDAPHRRDRLWFVAHAVGEGRGQAGLPPAGNRPTDRVRAGDRFGDASAAGDGTGAMADAEGIGQREPHDEDSTITDGRPPRPLSVERGYWGNHGWIIGHDGKVRRVEPSIRLLAYGVPARVGRLRAYGNAIVPQVAAEVIRAFMECPELPND